MIARALLAMTFAGLSTAHAQVVEVATMQETLYAITAKTLVIYDLDNTLIRPSQTLGSDQWLGIWSSKPRLRELLRAKPIRWS